MSVLTILKNFAPAIEGDGEVEVIDPDWNLSLSLLCEVDHTPCSIAIGASKGEVCADNLQPWEHSRACMLSVVYSSKLIFATRLSFFF